jgi:hypothetical protein
VEPAEVATPVGAEAEAETSEAPVVAHSSPAVEGMTEDAVDAGFGAELDLDELD